MGADVMPPTQWCQKVGIVPAGKGKSIGVVDFLGRVGTMIDGAFGAEFLVKHVTDSDLDITRKFFLNIIFHRRFIVLRHHLFSNVHHSSHFNRISYIVDHRHVQSFSPVPNPFMFILLIFLFLHNGPFFLLNFLFPLVKEFAEQLVEIVAATLQVEEFFKGFWGKIL